MDAVWIVLGALVLLLTLLDTFLAVLNYDEGGLFVDKIVRGQWLVLRAITRRVDRRWRPLVLRQVTGVLLLTTIFWWLLGIILGYALMYLGAMGHTDAFQISPGVERDFWGAFYLSVGQFATVGVDNISPGVAVLDLLTVSEAMVSIVLLSFIITFLGSVYGVIQSLRSFCGNFFTVGRGIGDPVETLAPFFPDGVSRGLDGQLGAIVDSMGSYADGLSQNRAAYYFQSGRDQFSLPFALAMTGGVIGALRWGLPEGSDPGKEPNLARLMELYEDLRLRMQRTFGLPEPTLRSPVSASEFAEAVAAFGSAGSRALSDPWVLRFLAIDRRMAELTHSAAATEPAEAYRRYTQWLPFEVRSRTFVTAVSQDLDYQPIYHEIVTSPDGIPLGPVDAATLPADVTPPPGAHRTRPQRNALVRWLRRRHLLIDPGQVRFIAAMRSLIAVVAAVLIVIPLAALAGRDVSAAAVFAGLVSLFATAAASTGGRKRAWWSNGLTVVPALIGAALGVLLPREPVLAIFELAAIAALATWVRRFGPAVGGLGQLAFLTYYIARLLGLGIADLPSVLLAATVGLACSWIVALVPGPSVRRQIDAGIDALYERVFLLVDTMVDLISSGRRDARLVRTLRTEEAALLQTATSVSGNLDGDEIRGMPASRARALRVRVFDLQLATQSLITMLPATFSIAVTVQQRARLAADLLEVQERIDSYRAATRTGPGPAVGSAAAHDARRDEPSTAPDPARSGPPAEWPQEARRILGSIGELRAAISRLHDVQVAEEVETHAMAETSHPPTAGRGPAPSADARRAAARTADKQAVQAAVSTGLALFLGGFVSTSHQYWAAMPAFQVLSGSDAETRSKGFQRIVATIGGSGVAFTLAVVAGHDPGVAIPLLILSAFVMSFIRSVSPAWTAFWMTLLLATVYDVLGTLNVETIEIRLAETAIGAVVAVVVSAIVLPTRTRTRVLKGMAGVVDTAAALSNDVFSRVLGAPTPTDQELSRAVRELDAKLGDVEKLSRPIQRNPGSLQASGIEAQLTCLWALLDYEGHAMRLLRRFAGDSSSAARWRDLSVATSENFEAVRAVLSGSLPQRVHVLPEVGEDPSATELERTMILQVLRLNQTLLALLDAVAPGTVASMTNGRDPARQSGRDAGGADARA
ncbi:FUSC family protein [Microbacterium caowuchunii]|uniref:Integral membrane bound transporter domain-containing protein n=1 Tax=Microbacterium caowuchunii TaxID=2614638 RepID=A0A5N0T4G6_9MICO|nr:FUSC family protein [Microbacterium caowuchunii]KAA9129960.1 hypothetical protein F6B40_14810 [Microbacterium caowuchunii]